MDEDVNFRLVNKQNISEYLQSGDGVANLTILCETQPDNLVDNCVVVMRAICEGLKPLERPEKLVLV